MNNANATWEIDKFMNYNQTYQEPLIQQPHMQQQQLVPQPQKGQESFYVTYPLPENYNRQQAQISNYTQPSTSQQQYANSNANTQQSGRDDSSGSSSSSSSSSSGDDSDTGTCVAKRKKGRKRRKRTKKNKNAKRTKNVETSSKSSTTRKRRGRPRGSKNKPKVNLLIVINPDTNEEVGIIECQFKDNSGRISGIIKKYKDSKIHYQNKSLSPEASDIVMRSTKI